MKINIHSFIDVITNSSTEIYVQATDHTIQAVRGMVDTLLEAAGSDKKADDLFTFKIDEEGYLEVSAKQEDVRLVAVAEILSHLTDLFNIDGEYNG